MADTNEAGRAPAGQHALASRVSIRIDMEEDIARARRTAKIVMENLGFSPVSVMPVLISVTELATNLFVHAAPGGEILLHEVQTEGLIGIEVVALDRGPGIEDIELAMQDRFSTAGSMGCGLPAVERLMDEFEISFQVEEGTGRGTRIVARKWRR